MNKLEEGKKILKELGYKLIYEDKRQIRLDKKEKYTNGNCFNISIEICPLDELIYTNRYDMTEEKYVDVYLTMEELKAINLICEGLNLL